MAGSWDPPVGHVVYLLQRGLSIAGGITRSSGPPSATRRGRPRGLSIAGGPATLDPTATERRVSPAGPPNPRRLGGQQTWTKPSNQQQCQGVHRPGRNQRQCQGVYKSGRATNKNVFRPGRSQNQYIYAASMGIMYKTSIRWRRCVETCITGLNP
jgi:hypothetical protein